MARRLVLDIEGNGLLPEVTKVHCIAAADPDTGERLDWKFDQLPQAFETLSSADLLIAHFGLLYDFPALEKVCGFKVPAHKQHDTVVSSRLIHPDMPEKDRERVRLGVMPGAMSGKHSIEAWGYRLGIPKLHTDIEDWSEWTPEMHERCIGDVQTNVAVWHELKPWEYSQQALELEHRIARVCGLITDAGWPFDMRKAAALHVELVREKEEIEKALVSQFKFWFEPSVKKLGPDGCPLTFTPKRDNPRLGYTAGAPLTKLEKITFNPGSRPHIFKQLQLLGWVPDQFTDGGQPKVDDEILNALAEEYPQATSIARYLMLEKRLGQLAEGKKSWLQNVGEDGRVHASYNPMGCVTSRASHYSPNIAQVPAIKDRMGRVQPFGRECRELFHAPAGWKQIGADMSGLELRCLAHYLHPMDDGEYAGVVLEGDVHSFNQKAAGLPDRNMAKTFIYAWLYGAGAKKIGSIVGGGTREGMRLNERFLAGLPAVKKLKSMVLHNVKVLRKHLGGLDGRLLPIRSDHSALNTLLQSAGALLCKQWVCDAYDALVAAGFVHGWQGNFVFLGWIHDELQIAVKDGIEEEVARIVTDCARKAGEAFKFRVRLDSDYKVGRSWADCH